MNASVAWRDSEVELHRFVRTIHDLFEPQSNRDWLIQRLHEYVARRDAGEDAEREWESRRRAYFEVDVFKRGMSKFRDRTTKPVGEFEWAKYARPLTPVDVEAVSAALKRGVFTTVEIKGGHEIPRRVECFEQSSGGAWIYVHAWTPPELCEFDRGTKAHLPLPPDLERKYADAEVCMGLALLHDADGSFAPLLSFKDALADDLKVERFWEEALLKGVNDFSDTRARSSWTLSQEPLLDQIKATLPTEFDADREKLRTGQDAATSENVAQSDAPTQWTIPMTKSLAARYLRCPVTNKAEWINNCQKDGTLKFQRCTRQSYRFNLDAFSLDLHEKLRLNLTHTNSPDFVEN